MRLALITLAALLLTPALAQLKTTGETTRTAAGLTLPAEAQVVEPLSCAEYVVRWSLATDPVMSETLAPEERESVVQEQLDYVRAEVQQGKVSCVLFAQGERQALHAALTQQLMGAGYTANEEELIVVGGDRSEWWESASGGRVDAFYALENPAGLLAFWYVY